MPVEIYLIRKLKVFRDINDLPCEMCSVVSTGTFDGVHIAHQNIIFRMIEISKKENLTPVIITFEPHPRLVLNQDYSLKLLTTTEEKLEIFERLGIENVVIIEFTKQFASTPYEDYIKNVLVKKLGAKSIVIGFNHQFGAKRSGNHNSLIELSAPQGYNVEEVQPLSFNGEVVSSTKIRRLLDKSQIELAAEYLGYYYSLSGTVVHGFKRGKMLGYPTANIKVSNPLKQLPANGVYITEVVYDNKKFYGMCSVGINPTFENKVISIEVHIFGFDLNIYNKPLTIRFLKFIRNEMAFSKKQMLIQQLKKDEEFSMNFIQENNV